MAVQHGDSECDLLRGNLKPLRSSFACKFGFSAPNRSFADSVLEILLRYAREYWPTDDYDDLAVS